MALNLALIGAVARSPRHAWPNPPSLDPFNRHSPQVVDGLLNENGDAGQASRLAYSASGTWLAMASVAAKTRLLTVSIFDLIAGSKLVSSEQCILGGDLAAFTWCGASWVVAATANGILHVFDPHLGQSFRRIEPPKLDSPVISVAPFPCQDELILLLQSGTLITSHGSILLHSPLASDESAVVDCHWHAPSRVVFLATNRSIMVVDLESKRLVPYSQDCPALSLGSTIQTVVTDQAGTRIAATMKDKSIRIISVERHGGGEGGPVQAISLAATLRLLDAVNRWPWSMVGFSHDGELVWGSFKEQGRHLVYLWDACTGAMVKMLEGPREDLVAAIWNPRKPALITAGALGTLFHWTPDYPARWTALVPGLEEIEENVIYQEREDEFDLSVEEELTAQRKQTVATQIDGPVDVLSRDHNEIVIEPLPLFITLGREE